MNHVNKTFRMLCPAHQFIKFQKSYIYNFFIFGLVFRKWVGGGGGRRQGCIFILPVHMKKDVLKDSRSQKSEYMIRQWLRLLTDQFYQCNLRYQINVINIKLYFKCLHIYMFLEFLSVINATCFRVVRLQSTVACILNFTRSNASSIIGYKIQWILICGFLACCLSVI